MVGPVEHRDQNRERRPIHPNRNEALGGGVEVLACTWDARRDALFVSVQARLTDHFLRRLEERGGNLERLVVENGFIVVEGWLRAVHDHDFNLVVPGFGQIRIRVDRFGGGGFVAVTFLPLGGS